MRKLLLVSVFVLFSVTYLSGAQSNMLSPCTNEELAIAYEIQPGYEALTELAVGIETMDDLLAYGDAHILWRNETWSALPICSEMLELALSTSQNADVFLSAILLDLIGVPREDNQYVELLYSGVEEYQRLGAEIVSAIGNAQASESSSGASSALPRCSEAQMQIIVDKILPRFQQLANAGFESFEAQATTKILQYIAAKIRWRKEIWTSLPLCAEAYNLGVFLYNYSSDLAKMSILDFADIPRGNNPYRNEFLRGFVRLVELNDWFGAAGEGYFDLLPCSEYTIDIELYDAFADHLNLTEIPTDNVDQLQDFGKAHIEWREGLWSRLPLLPGCAEAFETALLTVQVTGDGAAFAALAQTGIGYFDLALPYGDRVVAAGNRIDELDSLLAIVWKTQSSPAVRSLPACSAAETDNIAGSLQELSGLTDLGLAIETADDLISYIELQFEWRDQLWSNLSGCAEVFEIALLMIQAAGDIATRAALDLAGIPADANPYSAPINSSLAQIEQLQNEIGTSADEPAEEPPSATTVATEIYYVTANPYVNIRSCASTSCDIVATAQNGEALAVIDDSGDWYEVVLENGETAFIAGFLASTAPHRQ